MDEEDVDAYHASQASYGSEIHHSNLTKKGYQIDRALSSYNYRVYAKQGKAIVVFRGTKLSNISDLEADKDILLNRQKHNTQFRMATIIGQKAKQKYKNIVFTGHSLGGTKAIEAANHTNSKAIVFNPGTGLVPLRTGNHKVFVKDKDIISSRVRGQNIWKSAGSHSLSDYEPQIKQVSRKRWKGK